MNERIRELIQMADLCAAGLMASGATEEEIQTRSKVVLANLIVQECAEICDGISEWYETRTDLNQTQKQVGQLAAEVCGVRIRERIGP